MLAIYSIVVLTSIFFSKDGYFPKDFVKEDKFYEG
jgi:hypothetical protein